MAQTTIPSGSPDFPSAVVSPMLSSPPQLLVYQRRAPSQLAPEPPDDLCRSQREHTFNVKLSDFVASAEIFTSLMEGGENRLFWKAVQHLHWWDAMRAEYDSIMLNETWSSEDLKVKKTHHDTLDFKMKLGLPKQSVESPTHRPRIPTTPRDRL